MVERFLLHYYGMSAHTYTRGTWTTPEAAHPDRDVGSTDYVAAGVHTAPSYLKWALVFEEPNSRAVWLAKALPREWLTPPAPPVVVRRAPTRYGRVTYTLTAASGPAETSSRGGGRRHRRYRVVANVSLPASFNPPGGLRLRLRAPAALAGKLARVTVGGAPWYAFDAHAETVDFDRSALMREGLFAAMQSIVAEWAEE